MKNNKNYENKIYKNETRNKELKLVNLFSRGSDNDEKAKKILTILNICFSGISAFTETDHNRIVDNLYFNQAFNLIDTKIVKMTRLVSVSESTLRRYRNKYCNVAEVVLYLIEHSNL